MIPLQRARDTITESMHSKPTISFSAATAYDVRGIATSTCSDVHYSIVTTQCMQASACS